MDNSRSQYSPGYLPLLASPMSTCPIRDGNAAPQRGFGNEGQGPPTMSILPSYVVEHKANHHKPIAATEPRWGCWTIATNDGNSRPIGFAPRSRSAPCPWHAGPSRRRLPGCWTSGGCVSRGHLARICCLLLQYPDPLSYASNPPEASNVPKPGPVVPLRR